MTEPGFLLKDMVSMTKNDTLVDVVFLCFKAWLSYTRLFSFGQVVEGASAG